MALADAEPPTPGSNNWAVGGKRTRHGGAILACDMHLHLGVPNIWYRAAMEWAGRRLVGATLPGTPALVIGSNGHVAWGFTNAEVDSTDLVVTDAPAERFTETIHVLGGAASDGRGRGDGRGAGVSTAITGAGGACCGGWPIGRKP